MKYVIYNITLSVILVSYISFVKFVVDIFVSHIKTKFVIRMYNSYAQNNDNSYIRIFIVSPVRLYRLMLQILFYDSSIIMVLCIVAYIQNRITTVKCHKEMPAINLKIYSCNLEKNCLKVINSDQLSYFRIILRGYLFMQILIRYLRISKAHPTMLECGPLSRTVGECQPRWIREYNKRIVIRSESIRLKWRRGWTTDDVILVPDRTHTPSITCTLREHGWLYCLFYCLPVSNVDTLHSKFLLLWIFFGFFCNCVTDVSLRICPLFLRIGAYTR